MSAQYPELFEALQSAGTSFDYKEHWQETIKRASTLIAQDDFYYRSVSYSRNNHTIAALLASDPQLRTLAINAGIDVRAFDNIVGQAKQLMLTHAQKQPTGAKLVIVLNKLSTPF